MPDNHWVRALTNVPDNNLYLLPNHNGIIFDKKQNMKAQEYCAEKVQNHFIKFHLKKTWICWGDDRIAGTLWCSHEKLFFDSLVITV